MFINTYLSTYNLRSNYRHISIYLQCLLTLKNWKLSTYDVYLRKMCSVYLLGSVYLRDYFVNTVYKHCIYRVYSPYPQKNQGLMSAAGDFFFSPPYFSRNYNVYFIQNVSNRQMFINTYLSIYNVYLQQIIETCLIDNMFTL